MAEAARQGSDQRLTKNKAEEDSGQQAREREQPASLDMSEVASSTSPVVRTRSWWSLQMPRGWTLLYDILLLLALNIFLLYGISSQFPQLNSDAAKYQCYAVAFWQGTEALKSLPTTQCAFITAGAQNRVTGTQRNNAGQPAQISLPPSLEQWAQEQPTQQAFHALPHEYPLLAIIPFSLGLLAPTGLYQWAFALWMALVTVVIYSALLRTRSRQTALMFVLLLALGGWATALGRFDLVPAALTLLALIAADNQRWRWAFMLLALATLLKFYPVLLACPFLIAQQSQDTRRWHDWRRFIPLAIFTLTGIIVMGISALLGIEGTLAPISYFLYRPVQVESFAASLLQVSSVLSGTPLHFEFSYGSRNLVSALSPLITQGAELLLLLGICFTSWLQWQRKIQLAAAVLLILLLIILTGKVFSAQYLIWVLPIIAYVGSASGDGS